MSSTACESVALAYQPPSTSYPFHRPQNTSGSEGVNVGKGEELFQAKDRAVTQENSLAWSRKQQNFPLL